MRTENSKLKTQNSSRPIIPQIPHKVIFQDRDVIAIRQGALVERFAALVPPGTSLTHAALQYTLAQPAASTSISGAKSVEQALDNFAAANNHLTADVVRAIDALWEDGLKDDPLPW
jgi:aryl-alcohol dehydrogenase-like predicted oxidoreductase